MKILCIDDDDAILQVLRRMLTDPSFPGLEISTTRSGEEGLRMLEAEAYEIMVLDLMLPGMEGPEVLEKALAIRPELLVIMVTGFASVESAVNALKHGAVDYVTKPFFPSEFRERIKNLCRVAGLLKKSEECRRLQESAEQCEAVMRGLEQRVGLMEECRTRIGSILDEDQLADHEKLRHIRAIIAH